MSTDTLTFDVGEATGLARNALASAGLSADEAAIVADHLVDAELVGHAAAGLARIPLLAAMPEMRQPRRVPAVTRETPVSASIAGGNSLGYVAMDLATRVAIDKAGTSGIAIVGVHDAWNSGRCGYWVERVARAGFAAIHTVSTPPLVVPQGATARGLGTNPLAIALPAEPDPIVLDMATSAVSWAEVVRRAAEGGQFETAVGVDRDGVATAEATAIRDGGLSPHGGKGQALAFAIQALGLMAGARRRRGDLVDFGYLLIAFDPGLFGEPGDFARDVDELVAAHLRLPLRPGRQPLRIPGEQGARSRREGRRDGLALPSALAAELRRMADAAPSAV